MNYRNSHDDVHRTYTSSTCILNEDTQPAIRAIGVSHTAVAKMSVDKIFDLTAGVILFSSHSVPGAQTD